MSKFEGHSLGPWSREGWLILDGYGISVCRVKPWDSSGCRIDDNADAELIAAAPDLLAERDRLLEEVAALQAEIDVDTSLISDYATEQDRLRDALQDIVDLQNHPQDAEIARTALKNRSEGGLTSSDLSTGDNK